MKFSLSSCLAVATTAVGLASAISPQEFSKKHGPKAIQAIEKRTNPAHIAPKPVGLHGKKLKAYNNKTKQFWVNGTAGAIPDVKFDIPESYAGLLPISKAKDESRELFFWYYPTTGGKETEDDLVVWLNGGPGCSSLEGILQENGPFLWQYGTFLPVPNEYTWINETNMVWVEQPVGTGFSRGVPSATSEEDVAEQFLGFMKNFVDTFSLHGKKIWITGESYAGMYVPYIADAMYAKKDCRNFNIQGIMIYDPSIASDVLLEQAPAAAFVNKWEGVFALNETTMKDINERADKCGYTALLEYGLSYPPKGKLNVSDVVAPGCDLFDDIYTYASAVNPCFDIYEITTTCPNLWDVLGFPGSFGYLPEGAQIYFAREDVQKAINAPHIDWEECASENVFVNGTDTSEPSSIVVLPRVIEKSKRTVVVHGLLDYVLMSNGTRMAIQNMTWNGVQGFQKAPDAPWSIKYDGLGTVGTAYTERGLTYAEVNLSGHMGPQYAPQASYELLRFLLGRIDKLTTY